MIDGEKQTIRWFIATRNQRGVAALEFAIILPLLILLLFGIIEFGLLIYNQHIITNASREGARSGIVARAPALTSGELQTGIDNLIKNYCQDKLITFGSASDPVVTVTLSDNFTFPSDTFGEDLTVAVNYQYDFLVIPISIGPIQAETIMKMEK